MNRSETKPNEIGQVSEQVTRMDKALLEAAGALEALAKKLTPVLRLSGPEVTTPQAENPLVPLAEALHGQVERVEALWRHADSICSRIEL
jgi:hypothetical protein